MIKKTSKKGHVYVLVDSAYPQHIKMGYTEDLEKRLRHINSNKPFKTAEYIYTSEKCDDVIRAYNRIQILLIEDNDYVNGARGLKKGWNLASNREAIKKAISDWLNS